MTLSASTMITNSAIRRLCGATAVKTRAGALRTVGLRAGALRPGAFRAGVSRTGALRSGAVLVRAEPGAAFARGPCVVTLRAAGRLATGCFARAGCAFARGVDAVFEGAVRVVAVFVLTRFAAGALAAGDFVRLGARYRTRGAGTASRPGGGGAGCGSLPPGRVPAPTRPRCGRPLRPGTSLWITAARQGASSPSPSHGRGSVCSHLRRRSRWRPPSTPAGSRTGGSSPGSCRGSWRA